ncbi:MAG TPA: amino acid adenylation domain-containing protein [Pilimelia sp.]|nr:amino acid adenylation domain-containing protein [Pilimelia sp.]
MTSEGNASGPGQPVLSWAQRGMWLRERLSPHSPAHRICRTYRIHGPLSVPALRSAWRAVRDRHEILRSVLVEEAGRPVAHVSSDGSGAFAAVDLRHLPPAARPAEADRLCAAATTGPLDPAAGPLARLTVVTLTDADHRVVLLLHRTVADDRSAEIVADELSGCYARVAGARRGPARPPGRPTRYADYARWQRGLEDTARFRRLRQWWTAALTPPPPPIVLPADRDPAATAGDPPAPAAVASDVLPFDWGPGTRRRIDALADEVGTTPYAVLLAAFQTLLHRYGGASRVPVAVPVPVRPRRYADVVGPCDNLLVLSADFAGAPTFRRLLARVARTVAAALDRRDLPFPYAVRDLDLPRDPARVPLAGALLVVRDGPATPLRLAGCDARPMHPVADPVAADLALVVGLPDPTVAGALVYRGDLLSPPAAGALLDQLRTLLEAALRAPDTTVDALPLDPAERRSATARTADRLAAAPVDVRVDELVARVARRDPAAPAVATGDRVVSYGELDRWSAALAAELRPVGVAGAPVAVRLPAGPLQLAASLAVWRAGGQLLWSGTGEAGERGRAVLAELRPACLLRDGAAAADPLADWYRDELGGRVIDLRAEAGGPVSGPADRPGGAGEPAYVAYTSGSTGRPKGIAQTHGALGQFVTWFGGELGIGPGSRVAQWVTPEHDPSICEVFATLVAGGTLCPVPQRIRVHPEKLADWLAAERITFLQTVPSFARELLRAVADRRPADRPTGLRCLALMGEALPAELVTAARAVLPGARLVNLYGPTETIAATWHEVTGPVDGTVPIGRPIPGRQVLVLDERDRECPTGVTGEIVIRSRYVAAGYLGDPDGGRAFRPPADRPAGRSADDRWYRTGDLARWRWDGVLEFRGRRDHQVKLLGNRLELAEVEAALAAHPTVAECAVLPVTDRDGLVVRLVAYVVPRDRSTSDAGAWRAHLRQRFGSAVLLVSFDTLAGPLPRTVVGKIDRRGLAAARPADLAAAQPMTAAEEAVAALWAELLGARPARAGDTFFTLGGHSLLVPRLAHRIRARFGVDVTPRDLFDNSTLAGMAALVTAAGSQDGTAQPDSTAVALSPT